MAGSTARNSMCAVASRRCGVDCPPHCATCARLQGGRGRLQGGARRVSKGLGGNHFFVGGSPSKAWFKPLGTPRLGGMRRGRSRTFTSARRGGRQSIKLTARSAPARTTQISFFRGHRPLLRPPPLGSPGGDTHSPSDGAAADVVTAEHAQRLGLPRSVRPAQPTLQHRRVEVG